MSAPFTTNSSTTLEQKKYVVAYLEFIDANKKMKNAEDSNRLLQQINNIYEYIKTVKWRAEKFKFANVETRIFSSNIVLAKQVESGDCNPPHSPRELPPYYSVAAFAYIFMLESLKNGLFVRGAITLGDFVIDEKFIYGEALVNAYELEHFCAIYPRIIVDRKLMDFLQKEHKQDQSLILFASELDFDGEYFLRFINSSFGFYSQEEQKDIIEKIGKNIATELRKSDNDIQRRQKFYWIMQKFNAACDEFDFSQQKIDFNGEVHPAEKRVIKKC